MNTKFGQLTSTLIIVGLTLFWSTSILAADSVNAELSSDPAKVSVVLAADANEAAAEAAMESIAKDAKIELDDVVLEIRAIDPSSLRAAAD